MKIHSIASNVNFGYNKQLNEKVNKKLEKAKGNKELAKTLLDMNKMCMETEDKLRQAEKNKNNRLVDTYSHILLGIKSPTTYLLDERFPQLNYRVNELDSYKEEIEKRKIKDDFHWLREISEDLMDDEEFDAVISAKLDSLDNDVQNGSAESSEKVDKSDNNKTNKSLECLEEFKPNEFSPKGFESLGGMDEVKEALADKIIFPIQNPEMAKLDEVEYGKKASRGVLFYGPPGCGKTAVTQALAMESGVPMYNLKVSKAGSSYVNGSAINIQKAYDYAVDVAKTTGKPVLLFMDEMESLAAKRSGGESGKEDNKVVSTLLPILEEARGKNVIIIGATNCFDQLDDAIKSRLEDKVYIGLPDDNTRKSVLKVLLNRRTKGHTLAADEDELAKVVKLTQGFSNRDLTILTDKASLIARKDGRRNIIAEDFIIPVRDNQNMKVKENNFQAKQTRPAVGFSQNQSQARVLRGGGN